MQSFAKYYISVKHPSYNVPLYISHTVVRRLEHDISLYSSEQFSEMAAKERLNISAGMGFPTKDGQMISMLVGARVTPNFTEAALFEDLPNWDSPHYSAILRLFHECKQHLVVEDLSAKSRLYSAGQIAKLAIVATAAAACVYLFNPYQAPKINETTRPNKIMHTDVLPPAGANMKCDTVIRSGDTIFMYRKNK